MPKGKKDKTAQGGKVNCQLLGADLVADGMSVAEAVEAVKRPVGCPRQFASPQAMQTVIDDYFESCFQEFTVELKGEDGKTKIGERQIKKQVEPFTITGLALALDLSRAGIMNYEGREEFVNTIKRAKLKCENFAEKSLFSGQSATGTIFNLINNYGWKNTTATEITGKDGGPIEHKTKHELSEEELIAIAAGRSN